MKRTVRTLSFAAFFLSTLAASLAAAEAPAPPKLRLPAGTAPTRYAAELWIDASKEKFEGKIEIGISLKGETGTVWLNGKELDIKAVSAQPAGGGEAIPAAPTSDGKDYVLSLIHISEPTRLGM